MYPYCRLVLFAFATTTTLTALVSARAVNISNMWMLPEEGFPVFYRYFRDRISWYEADAVCQFHHANLVNADTTSQYDAIRAYLKELDISENVWIGLSRTSEKPTFTWTNFQSLSGEGHWQLSVPVGNDPTCVAMDPAADFLWKPMSCGGPQVASFICELPVPSWALGPRGCLLTELPSLTVLYIPEQLALELTSDCGLDGTKRIACKGNADREEILRQLTCAIPTEDFDDKSTKDPLSQSNTASSSMASDPFSEDNSLNTKTTKPWIWTSNTIDIDYGMPTRHRRETEDTLSPSSTKTTTDLSTLKSSSSSSSSLAPSSLKSSAITVTSSESATVAEDDDNNETTATVSSASPEGVTLAVSARSDKSTGLRTTQVADLTTQDPNARPEEQAEMSRSAAATVETKAAESAVEDMMGEYPSAINQGQLFSIIENGTMFDIIELNDNTTTDDAKLVKNSHPNPIVIASTAQSHLTTLERSTSKQSKPSSTTDNSLYTTVVYHKEAPSEPTFVTNKSVKKHSAKKQLFPKEKDPKKVNQDKLSKQRKTNDLESVRDDKTLSKEVEMFPIMTDSLVKLNRTHRKELPFDESENLNSGFGNPSVLNFSTDNKMEENDDARHEHVEVKLQSGNKNSTHMTLFITTKRAKKAQEGSSSNDEDPRMIDSKLEVLNNNLTENNESETFLQPEPEKLEVVSDQLIPDESMLMKEQFLPKSLLGENTRNEADTSPPSASEDPLEPEPQAQPRPNRQRQLTRPQRRSFYPYFFSRVLG